MVHRVNQVVHNVFIQVSKWCIVQTKWCIMYLYKYPSSASCKPSGAAPLKKKPRENTATNPLPASRPGRPSTLWLFVGICHKPLLCMNCSQLLSGPSLHSCLSTIACYNSPSLCLHVVFQRFCHLNTPLIESSAPAFLGLRQNFIKDKGGHFLSCGWCLAAVPL